LTKELTNYFLNRLPEDLVCYWDLLFTEGNEQERDSSGAAIAVCGMLELAKHLPLLDVSRRLYENTSLHILKALADKYTTAAHPYSNGILMHSVYNNLAAGASTIAPYGAITIISKR
jgi:unsaturated chondroitin disaccharide hydrolase